MDTAEEDSVEPPDAVYVGDPDNEGECQYREDDGEHVLGSIKIEQMTVQCKRNYK